MTVLVLPLMHYSFFLGREDLGVHRLRCPSTTLFFRYLKICLLDPQITFIFSWLGNMLHSDTPIIVAIITEACRVQEESMEHPPPLKKSLLLFTCVNTMQISFNVFICSIYLRRMETTGLYFAMVCTLYGFIRWPDYEVMYCGCATAILVSKRITLMQHLI